LQIKEKNKT